MSWTQTLAHSNVEDEKEDKVLIPSWPQTLVNKNGKEKDKVLLPSATLISISIKVHFTQLHAEE